MRNPVWSVLLLVLFAASNAAAEDTPSARSFPGFASVSAGTLSPNEPGNVVSSTTLEQGVTAWQAGSLFLLGYTSVSRRNDMIGYGWNNNTPLTVGARLAKTWSFGVLQANGGITTVTNSSTARATGPIGYVSFWSGWRNDRSKSLPIELGFPGHFWASSGVVTPLEGRNWITSASGEQGVSILRLGRVEVVPYAAVTIVADTQHLTWNNKTMVDVGMKVQRFVPGGVVELGVARRDEHQRLTKTSRSAPVVFMNFWLGWNPRHYRQ